MKRICVVVTARPSWAKLEPVCAALKARSDVELQIVACASALLERYGNVSQVIEAQGYEITERVYSVIEGANVLTSVVESGVLCGALGRVLSRLRPDLVCVMADRHEVLAAAQAAAYQHLRLVHFQGGERTGSIDDKVRDSITALADIHFPATKLAALRVYSLTGSDRVYNTGCPSIDVAKRALSEPPVTVEELGGAGAQIDLSQPFGILLQHPVTNEADQAYAQLRMTVEAWPAALPCVAMWPGQDAGSEAASKALREAQGRFHTVRNLPPNRFLRLMAQCAVIVGNSSASVREGAFLGTPAVVIGTRQWGRETAWNVETAPHDVDTIADQIEKQIAHGRYPSSALYGDGSAGEKIAEVLSEAGRDTHSAGSGQPGLSTYRRVARRRAV